MSTDEMLDRLLRYGDVKFALAPSRTRVFCWFNGRPYELSVPVHVSALADTPNEALLGAYDKVVQAITDGAK